MAHMDMTIRHDVVFSSGHLPLRSDGPIRRRSDGILSPPDRRRLGNRYRVKVFVIWQGHPPLRPALASARHEERNSGLPWGWGLRLVLGSAVGDRYRVIVADAGSAVALLTALLDAAAETWRGPPLAGRTTAQTTGRAS